MKVNKAILLSTLAILFVVYLVRPTLADRPPSPQEAVDWTKAKVNAFVNKYNLGYDKHVDESSLRQKVQEYEKAAKNNAQYFGAKVDHFINNIKIDLEKHHELSQHDMDGVVSNLQHSLRQLELQGQLTRDKVEQSIDKVQRQLANKKSISESSWKSIKNDVASQFTESYYRPSWFQRVFSSSSSSSSSVKSAASDAKSSIDQWLDHVQDRLRDLRVLTDNQLQAVMDQLRQAVTHRNLHKLASKHWYERLYHRLEKKAKLTEAQKDQIKDALEEEVNSYKVFATDYLGTKVNQSKEWMDGVYHYCCEAVDSCKSSLEDWLHYGMARFHEAVKGLQHRQQHVKDKAVDDWNEAKDSAIKTEQDWKRNFDHYWQSKHLEAYRRLGYSEAQINHMKRAITSAFHDKQSLAQKNVDTTLDSMKQYMQQARVQTSAQIQTEIDKIKRQLDHWKARLQ
ncbi:unnamed protein product [Absidia cylindrospora]